jgi:hypothetical protein
MDEDEISHEPRHDLRLPPRLWRWLGVVGIGGLVGLITVFGVARLGGHHGSHAGSPAASVPTATVPDESESVIYASLLPFVPGLAPATILPSPVPAQQATSPVPHRSRAAAG